MEVARRTSRTSPTPMDPELARTEGQGRARPSETFLPGFEGRDIEASEAPAFISQEAGRAAARAAARPCPSPPFLAQDHAPLGWALSWLRQLRQAGGRRGSCERQQARLAADQVEVMRPLGFHGFAVVERDRSNRVMHRTALDHPDVMERISLGARFWAGCAALWRMTS